MKVHHTVFAVLLTLPLVALTACDNRASTPTQPMQIDERSATRQVDDSSLNRDVSNALQRDVAFARNNIMVVADKGHITLTGTVGSQQEKNHATDIARNVEGVIAVHNNLEVARAETGY